MPETCENWLSLVNSCVYLSHRTRDISQVLPYSVHSKAPGELWQPLGKAVLGKCSFMSIFFPVLETESVLLEVQSVLF